MWSFMARGDAISRARAAESPRARALLIGAICRRDLGAISARSWRDRVVLSARARRELGASSA